MEYLTGKTEKKTLGIQDILAGEYEGKEVTVNGAVHKIRDMGDVAFVVLRKSEGLLQTVYEDGVTDISLKELQEEDTVCVTGVVAKEERAPHGFEIRLRTVTILSKPTEPMPIAINIWKMNTSLETKLDLRPLSLRNVKERAKFRIQEGIIRGFRDFLHEQGFTEIHSPKIGARGAEGGANLFRLEYFHKHAVLAQSPQFYKQMMVGVFDRVFEAAPVFRAEKHNTKRHLNEYTSLDFEMGYIDSFEDIMEMETGFLQYTMELLQKEYKKELDLLKVTLPKVDKIPQVRFDKAKELVAEKYNRTIRNPFDLEPEEEALSFDLLFHGLEITTGGQRIHDYQTLVDKIADRGMTQEGMEQYMMIFKHGMPPHGGLGIGMERLTMKLLGEENVRETTLFPRDLNRLEP